MRCRNPIRHGRFTIDPADGVSAFHDDCWRVEQVEVQASYRAHVRERGVLELLSTYGRHPSSSFAGRCDPFADDEQVTGEQVTGEQAAGEPAAAGPMPA